METFPLEPISPPIWSTSIFDKLLIWAVEHDASDINIIPHFPVMIRIHGGWKAVTKGVFPPKNIEELVPELTSNAGSLGMLFSAKDLDFSYDVHKARGERVRFRVNATACQSRFGKAINLVLRSIPTTPPSVKDLKLEKDLLDGIFPAQGLVLIAGTMGSGKTTLLAALMRYIREFQPSRWTVTYESPIEFDLTNIPGATGPLVQTEIPTHIPKFEHAPVNATRRAIDVILVGESRELETFRGIAESSEVGSATYTTVHTLSVAETVRRVIGKFPVPERPYIAATVLGNLKTLVYQTLVPKVDGGRIAVREWLHISKSFRSQLLETDLHDLPELFHQEIYANGQPLLPYAERLLEEGLIESETFSQVQKKHAFENVAQG